MLPSVTAAPVKIVSRTLDDTLKRTKKNGAAPANDEIRRTDDGAGAPAGAVVLSVAAIVVPAGAPAPKVNVEAWPARVGSTTLPPVLGIARVVDTGPGVGVGDAVGLTGGVVPVLFEQLATRLAPWTNRTAAPNRA